MALTDSAKIFLLHFEIGAAYRGFDYFITCMELLEEDPEYLNFITKSLYPEIAKRHKTSCASVERNLRTVAEVIWKKGGKTLFENSFGELGERRPTNSQFIGMAYAYLSGQQTCCPAKPLKKDPSCKTCVFRVRAVALEKENKWMHDLIWKLLTEQKANGSICKKAGRTKEENF